MLKRHLTTFSVITCFILSLVGCTKAPNEANFAYHKRLNTQLSLPELIPYQDSKKLIVPAIDEPTKHTIGILQLNKLQGCKLGQLIAEHNSQLGKVRSASSEFIYNVRFIQLVPECVTTLNDAQLAKQLNEVKHQKSDILFTYWQKMLFLDKQLASFYLPTSYSMGNVSQVQKQDTLNALHYLASIKSAMVSKQYNHISIGELEAHLATLFKNNYLPSLLRALYEQIFILQQQNNALDAVSLDGLCKVGHHNQSAMILSNIFSKFYGTHIQRYHNVLLREFSQLKPALSQLWQNQEQQPFTSLIAIHPLDLDESLKQHSIKHVRWWQQLYTRCKIKPGA